MTPLSRRERVLVGLWVIVGIVVWNGIYDVILDGGVKEYLFRSVLHQAGRGPRVAIDTIVDPYIFDALWIATFWASLLLLAGLVTIRSLRRS